MKAVLYSGILCLWLMPFGANARAAPQTRVAVGEMFRSGEARAADKRYRFTVSPDGKGDFTSVQEAINHVPDYSPRQFVIRIRPGVYKEQIKISQTKPFITLQGEDPLRTKLTFDLSAKTSGDTRLSYSTYIGGSDFRAENITFENSYGTGSQAVAIYVNTDRAVFLNCRFLGWQDTLFANGGRQFYKDCYIEGHVDFIFGNGTAVFENCTIHSKGQGYVTAHWRVNDSETNGFVFLNCKLTGAHTGNGVYLGRPWRPFGRVVFINTWMDDHVRPEGWDNWRDPAREKTARFAEYKSSGPGANPTRRVAWSRQFGAEDVKPFETTTFLRGADGWNPLKAK